MPHYPATWLGPQRWVAYRTTQLLKRLRASHPVTLHLGCGGKYIPGVINCDLYDSGADKAWDASNLSEVADTSVDMIEHHHLIEHLAFETLHDAVAEWSRVLRPGGLLVVSAPDLETVLRRWLLMTDTERWGYGIKMIFGSQEHAGMFHRNGFTPDRLARVLKHYHLHEEWHFRGYPRRPTPSFILIARKQFRSP